MFQFNVSYLACWERIELLVCNLPQLVPDCSEPLS